MCVLAVGFYEWTEEVGRDAKGKEKDFKQLWFISHSDNRLMLAAGLWDVWKRGDQEIASCAILTTEPIAFMAERHDRMPCFLDQSQIDAYLDPELTNVDAIMSFLKPWPKDDIQTWRVTRKMNSVKYKGGDCMIPVFPGAYENLSNLQGDLFQN